LVSEELTTEDPSVVLFSTLVLLMEYDWLVGMFTPPVFVCKLPQDIAVVVPMIVPVGPVVPAGPTDVMVEVLFQVMDDEVE
jgi:hypothetical protein